MKLLIAIDGSICADEVVDEVAGRQWPQATEARVLNVMHPRLLPSDFIEVEAFAETQSQAARTFVKSMAERLSSAGFEASGAVIEGYPRTAIVEYAKEWGADMLILGSHGHSSLTNLLLGSVASHVVRNATCSVEIVRQSKTESLAKGHKGMRILVATDGSVSSTAAVRSIAQRSWPSGTEVQVMSVADLTVPETAWFFNPEIMARIEEELIQIAKESITEAEDMLGKTDVKLTKVILRGNPKEFILNRAREWNADLVVVGSHGRRGFDRALQGSVSEAVALHAPCSVEVIRDQNGDR